MHLTNSETKKILLAENAREVQEVLANAADLSAWNGAEPLADHAPCLYEYLTRFTKEQRGTLSDKELVLESAGKDGMVRFDFCGKLADEELDNVSAGGDCMNLTGGINAFFKPVIYLYPEKEMKVTVRIPQDRMHFTCVYPALKDGGWEVVAKPDGTLTADGIIYNYLYWEGETGSEWADMSRGFCVPGAGMADFLENALSALGLNRREANEMIVYWLPLLQKNPYTLISFQFENYAAQAPLQITPAPDTLIRVYMVCKPLQKPVNIEPQELKAPERRGFTVVEWGGTV